MIRAIKFFLFIILLISLFSCGEEPFSKDDLKPIAITLPKDIENLLGDTATISIYDNGTLINKQLLSEVSQNRNFFAIGLMPGEHLIEIYVTGINETVIYALDKKRVSIYPEIKNSIDIELLPPIKFDSKVLNIQINQEVNITARIDSSRAPEGLKNPLLHWTIDNIEGGSEDLGTILVNGNTATIKGPSTLPHQTQNHYLGVYYEFEGKRYISVLPINYIE